MKLSIMTVNLNNREGLQKTIDSVVSQTFKDFEWIVIDGGSTDGSKELIEQYAGHFAYWVSEPDKGIYNAMNKGIKVAQGEYCQFLNSGDWLWGADVLQSFYDASQNEDIIYGDCIEADGTRSVFPGKIDSLFLYRWTINHQSAWIKSIWFKDEGYDESYRIASDWKFFLVSLMFKNASYRKVDIIATGVQGGHSYDPSLSAVERQDILDKVFPPMLQATMEELKAYSDRPMSPYYDYLQNNPRLEKWIRRLVRFHKKLKS